MRIVLVLDTGVETTTKVGPLEVPGFCQFARVVGSSTENIFEIGSKLHTSEETVGESWGRGEN